MLWFAPNWINDSDDWMNYVSTVVIGADGNVDSASGSNWQSQSPALFSTFSGNVSALQSEGTALTITAEGYGNNVHEGRGMPYPAAKPATDTEPEVVSEWWCVATTGTRYQAHVEDKTPAQLNPLYFGETFKYTAGYKIFASAGAASPSDSGVSAELTFIIVDSTVYMTVSAAVAGLIATQMF